MSTYQVGLHPTTKHQKRFIVLGQLWLYQMRGRQDVGRCPECPGTTFVEFCEADDLRERQRFGSVPLRNIDPGRRHLLRMRFPDMRFDSDNASQIVDGAIRAVHARVLAPHDSLGQYWPSSKSSP